MFCTPFNTYKEYFFHRAIFFSCVDWSENTKHFSMKKHYFFLFFFYFIIFFFFYFVPQVKETILYECFFPTLFHTGKMFFIHLASHTKKLIFFHKEFFFSCVELKGRSEKNMELGEFSFSCVELFSWVVNKLLQCSQVRKKNSLWFFFLLCFFFKKKYLFSCVERSGMTQISQGFFIYFFSACVEWWEYFIGDKIIIIFFPFWNQVKKHFLYYFDKDIYFFLYLFVSSLSFT